MLLNTHLPPLPVPLIGCHQYQIVKGRRRRAVKLHWKFIGIDRSVGGDDTEIY